MLRQHRIDRVVSVGVCAGQVGTPHQVDIDGAGRLTTLMNRPNHKGLATTRVASHEHLVTAGLILAVAGQDVAPIIYHLLDVTIPSDMDGHVPVEVFKPGTALANRHIDPQDFEIGERTFILAEEMDQEGIDKELIGRLQDLGYIE